MTSPGGRPQPSQRARRSGEELRRGEPIAGGEARDPRVTGPRPQSAQGSRPTGGRSRRERHRTWAVLAAVGAISALALSWNLVGLYASPDRPESPGWLAVYGDNVVNSDGKLAIQPFPAPRFKGVMRVVHEGTRLLGRFSVSAPHLPSE